MSFRNTLCMPSALTRFLLFLSSYFPLALIFFLLFVNQRPYLAASILFGGTVGLLGMAFYFRYAQRIGAFKVNVAAIQRRDGDAMSYIVSYVIPFLSVPFSGWEQGVALSIFFIVLSILYVNSNMIHINPMLNLVGYHLYEVTLQDGGVHSLISHRRVALNQALSVIKVGEDILFGEEDMSAKTNETSIAAASALANIFGLNLDDCEITVCLASFGVDDDIPRFEKLQLTDELTNDFRGVVKKMVGSWKVENENGDLELKRYEAGSKPESYELEYLEMSEHESIQKQIGVLSSIADLPLFSGDGDFLSGLRFYVIIVQPNRGRTAYFFSVVQS